MSAIGNGETRPSRPPTLRDVAREAGVHVSTVSRVLNDQAAAGRITQDTEERIREVARRLGYRRNTIARALRTGRTLVVGMVVPDVANLYQAGITRGAGDVLYADGYSLLLASTDDDPAHAESQVSAMLGVQAEGMMYGVAREDDAVLAGIIAEGIAVVLFNRAAPSLDVSAVLPDDHTGTRMAVEHLLALGHKRIVHVGGPEDVSSTVNRLEAFEEVLRTAELTGSHHFAHRQTEEEGYRVTGALLEEHPDTTAVVAANDRLALGAIDAVRASGRSCPEDVSVVGFNDMPYSERFSPPLTTVRISQYELGARTARLLLETIADPAKTPETQWVTPELVVRGSTAAPASATPGS
ncbi:MAG TPA: LacI family DNA-binding transcriptional regulator [Acidimicrobiia bacterium]|nr:LacI family DNA-binding transcriptional regulator [Acidimicrobiia bacterium]